MAPSLVNLYNSKKKKKNLNLSQGGKNVSESFFRWVCLVLNQELQPSEDQNLAV